MDPLFGFTRDEIAFLKRHLRSLMNRPVNTPQRPAISVDSVYVDPSGRPQLYIAVSPEGGIAGGEYTGTGTGEPGVDPYTLTAAECQVYAIDEATGLVEKVDGLTKMVWNLSGEDIPGAAWIFPKRDTYGEWIVETAATEGDQENNYYPQPSGGDCIVWYTEYLHLASVAVHEGEILRPRQFIGRLGRHPGGAHLHFSLGDGNQSQNPVPGAITAGVAVNIESWLTGMGVPITGSHVGTPPSPAADFTVPELATIEANFGFPLNTSLAWEAYILSTAHTGWDYYAIDFAIAPLDDQTEEGFEVYAAFSGPYVLTTVQFVGPGTDGYCVILRHQIGECPDGTGTTENTHHQGVGPGLTFINFQLAVYLGCGLMFDGNNAVTIDPEDLAGDRTESALIPGLGECDLAVDLLSASTTVEYLLIDDLVTISNGVLSQTRVWQEFTNHFNVAGLHINRVAGATTAATSTYNICNVGTCCDDPSDLVVDLVVTLIGSGGADLQTVVGLSPTTVYFSATASGGSGTYTYEWDWDDLDPTYLTEFGDTVEHTFTRLGYNIVRLTVRDDCSEFSVIVPVYITTQPECGECYGCDVGTTSYAAPYGYDVIFEGGTGAFEVFNGNWQVPFVSNPGGSVGCLYQIVVRDIRGQSPNDDVGITIIQGGSGILEVVATQGATRLTYHFVPPLDNCCSGVIDFTATESTGTGTPPLLTFGPIADCGTCSVGCEEYIADGNTLTRTGASQWSGSGYVLTATPGTDNWQVTIGGDTYTASGWDGTGCKLFYLNDSVPLINVCCH